MIRRFGYPVLATLLVAVLATLVYDYAWIWGVPLWLRNATGLLLFSCIMLSPAWVYGLSRLSGATWGRAVRLALVLPVLWHIKEIIAACKIFGIGPGIYTGLQGPYLFYYGLCFLAMGLGHLLVSLFWHERSGASVWRTPLFLLPLITLGSVEGLGFALFKYDLLFFQGFLAGYRALFGG
ncbi:MAG: hypothetical protein OSA45_07790 [Halioglobus sp.]|nr:hypothetical protein [Halioglobus sp.]